MQLRVTFLADYELANLQHHCQWLHLNYCLLNTPPRMDN